MNVKVGGASDAVYGWECACWMPDHTDWGHAFQEGVWQNSGIGLGRARFDGMDS